ncbi:MAG: glycosyltransferase family 4 protein [Candidatus Saccharimonadales bacterium]
MKIGLVCPYHMFRGGGVQEVVLALRDGIEARGHEAYIITPQPRNSNIAAPKNVLFVGGSVPFRAARTQSDISASRDMSALNALLRREDFDIIHFHEPWNPMLSLQIMSRSNAIHIATFHAAMSERRTSRTVEKVITPYTKSILKYTDIMTAVSYTATNYISTLTSRKIHIIGNGIDLSKYIPADEPQSRRNHKTILYVGRLEKRKGLQHLLEAFALLRRIHPEFRLSIAGDGPERKRLESYAKDNDIKYVSFLGYIDEPTKLRLLRQADIFCSPALYGESFGIVLLEAMASNCVVVAGNNTGYEGVLKGRGQLSLVNPKDTIEFARRLALLGLDDSLRAAWREWAQAEVKLYDYETIIDQYVALYQAACSKKQSLQARR